MFSLSTRTFKAAVVARMLAGVILLSACATPQSTEQRPEVLQQRPAVDALGVGEDVVRVFSLPVGAGSCHVVDCPGSAQKILIDCGTVGGRGPDDFTSERAEAYYWNQISGPEDPAPIVVVTHPDSDHYRHIEDILGDVSSGSIWLGGRYDDPEAFHARDKYGTDDFYAWVIQVECSMANCAVVDRSQVLRFVEPESVLESLEK